MSTVITPAPTYADVVLIDPATQKGKFNPIWLKWFLDLAGQVNISAGAVTASSGALTAEQLVLGNGGVDIKTLGSLGTTTQVLHGNAGGAPTWGAVSLTADVTGTLPVGKGGTGTATAFTAGSVIFAGASGIYAQDNASLFWDDSNNRLGIGTASPQTVLHVKGVARLESGTSGYIAFSPPTTGAAETYTWPAGPGTNDYVLTTNGSASTPTLSWTSKYWTRTLVSPGGSYVNFNVIADIAPAADVVRIGDQSASTVAPNGYTQLSVVSGWGRQAIFASSKTSKMNSSYPASSGEMDTTGIYIVTDHDSTQGGLNLASYGAYVDARASAGTTSSLGTVFAGEFTCQNISGTASVPIPSNYYPGGRNVAAMLLQAAGTSTATTYDSSAALVIGANAPNGAKGDGYAGNVSFNKGIIFLDYSIATISSAMEAIAMSANHQLTWTALGTTTPVGRLSSDGTHLTWASNGTTPKVKAPQFESTITTGTAPFVVASTTRVSNLNVATAGTADVLTTPRTIGTVSFDGSANINPIRLDTRTAANTTSFAWDGATYRFYVDNTNVASFTYVASPGSSTIAANI